ncbi:MAG: DUF4058 family protein [Planctomycetes bacterium]|nr:DUF4058 family protein [Planctomycetota bacterium]
MPIHDWTRVIPGTFHHFHHDWITSISRALNSGILPPDYYAMAEQIAGGLGPDVLTLGNTDPARATGSTGASRASGGVALAEATPKARFTARAELEPYTRKRNRIVIRHRSGDEVIAMIEIVSPGNKSNRHGLKSFVDKTLELLDAGIHLLIIDLFPPGPRDPQGIHGAIWSEVQSEKEFDLPTQEPLTLVSYECGDDLQAFIEPVAVGRELPDMPLFLRPQRHVLVPLEATYQSAFDGVPQRWRREVEPAPRNQS